MPKTVEEFTHWYMRWVSPLSLIAGFLLDNFVLLRRVDVWTSNALLLFYLLVSGACIVFLNLAESGRLNNPRALAVVPFLPIATQFSFGALFSAFLSLYGRSAAFATSWIFVVALALLIVLNERFTRLYMRLEVQIGVYFTVLFSFLIFFIPLIVHNIGPYVFLGSGAASVACVSMFLVLLRRLVPGIIAARMTRLARIVAMIYVSITVLYFSGAIPPLPLALKDAGVYHGVARTGDTYTLLSESLPWYEYYLRYNTTYHRAADEPVYVYTAVFAPSGLTTTLYHQWQTYDTTIGTWKTVGMIPFYVVGGRDDGYRGYSVKSMNLSEGRWRVNVVTEYGQVIGRVSFTILNVAVPAAVEATTR